MPNSDLSTTAQNAVTAINGLATTYVQVQGAKNAAGITAAVLVKSGQGRIARVSVIVAGSADGMIYDASVATATAAPIFVIPQTLGVFEVNFPLSFGLVVAPGTGQTVSVSYS